MGNPGGLVKRAQDARILSIQQVHTAKQACKAAELEVDTIIAQGTEAGGFCDNASALSLILQVIDEVGILCL